MLGDTYRASREEDADRALGSYQRALAIVENAIYSHPAVLEAAVIGVPDERWGEAVKAVVVLRPGHTLSSEEVIEHCRRQIAGYKLPKSVDFVAALPKSGAGKILKRELREPYWAGYQRRIHQPGCSSTDPEKEREDGADEETHSGACCGAAGRFRQIQDLTRILVRSMLTECRLGASQSRSR